MLALIVETTNAKNYNDSNYISISNNNITFTRNGSYYYSNVIYVTTNNLTSTPTVGVYNAPSSTTIVEKNVYANGSKITQVDSTNFATDQYATVTVK